MPEGLDLGDTVQLRSGGPLMTIDSFGVQHQGSETEGAWCSWFVKIKGNQERKTGWFEFHSIKKVNPDAESAFYPGNSIMG
jgi:uncharacterized protein YodC (DUF2158 family)